MEKLTRLTSEQRDNLTAYLDGELDEAETHKIESALAGSPVARTDVERLARTYELLDLLPRPKASGEFTERTLQTAKLSEVSVDLTQQAWYRQSRKLVTWAACLALLATTSGLGYLIARFRAPTHDDLILDHFEVIRKLDEYERGDSTRFAEALSQDRELLKRMGGRP